MAVRGLGPSGAFGRSVAVIAAALATAACGTLVNMMPDPADFKLPSRTTLLPNNIESYQRPVSVGPPGPRELVDAQGVCVGGGGPADTSQGIGLDMTECEVVRRLGQPQSAEITPRPADQRVAVLTYVSGDHAGIYRFTGGRLTSIERGAEPPPPPPSEKKPVRKPRPPANASQ